MSSIFLTPFYQVTDDDGNPLSGAKIFTYAAGTTTLSPTYSDPALTTANTNPIIADAAGRIDNVYLADQSYKFVVKTTDDVVVDTQDNYRVRDGGVNYLSVSALKASSDSALGADTIYKAGPYTYKEAVAVATDHHLTTAGGVKLYYVPKSGIWHVEALGVNEAALRKTHEIAPEYAEIQYPYRQVIYLTQSFDVVKHGQKVSGGLCRFDCAAGVADRFFDPLYLDNVHDVEISYLTVEPEAGTHAFDRAMNIRSCKNFTGYRLKLKNIGFEGDDPVNTERGWGFFFHAGDDAIPLAVNDATDVGCRNVKLLHCRADDIKGYGSRCGDGIYFESTDGAEIIDFRAARSRRMGIAITSQCSNINLDKIRIKDVYLAGIDVEPDHADTTGQITIHDVIIDGYGEKPAGFVGVQYFGIDLHSHEWDKCQISKVRIYARAAQAEEGIRAQNGSSDLQMSDVVIYCNGFAERGMFLNAGNGFKDIQLNNIKIYGFTQIGIDGYSNENIIADNIVLDSTQATVLYGVRLTENRQTSLDNVQYHCPNSGSGFIGVYVRNVGVANIQGVNGVQAGGKGVEVYYNSGDAALTETPVNDNIVTFGGHSIRSTSSGTTPYKISAVGGGAISDLAVMSSASAGFADKGQVSGSVPVVSLSSHTLTRNLSINFGTPAWGDAGFVNDVTLTGIRLADKGKWDIKVLFRDALIPGMSLHPVQIHADDVVRISHTSSLNSPGTAFGLRPVTIFAEQKVA